MRRPLIIGNWKMNGSVLSATALLKDVLAETLPASVDVAVCPSFVHVPLIKTLTANSGIQLGAQNVSEYESGAFTGEVSADMLAELGCSYVIVGHSERRSLFGETDEVVVTKIKRVIEAGMTPVLCVGETLSQREANAMESVIGGQIRTVQEGLDASELGKLVVAYEPVWAIGTGKTATPEQAQSVHAFIRNVWREHERTTSHASALRVLYGGSVKADNARLIFAQPDIDGGLVGGAALDARQFCTIIAAAV
jgi:triosephosphate isomerase